jgi:hypothetical protein
LGKLEVSVAHSACEWWQAKAALGREHGAGGRAGLTKGYSPDHTDFYVPNGRPKKLWLKELAPNAWVLMCARPLTAFLQAQPGCRIHYHRNLPPPCEVRGRQRRETSNIQHSTPNLQ